MIQQMLAIWSLVTIRHLGILKPLWQKVKRNSWWRWEEWKSWLKTQHLKNEDHGIWSHHFMGNRRGKNGMTDFIFLGSKITADGDCSHEIKRYLLLGRKAMTNLDSILKDRVITFADEGLYNQSYCFSSILVQIWSLDHQEGWGPKNWCFQTVALEKILRNPLDSKEIKPVNPNEINAEYSLEGLMLKLNLQYFGRLIQRADL